MKSLHQRITEALNPPPLPDGETGNAVYHAERVLHLLHRMILEEGENVARAQKFGLTVQPPDIAGKVLNPNIGVFAQPTDSAAPDPVLVLFEAAQILYLMANNTLNFTAGVLAARSMHEHGLAQHLAQFASMQNHNMTVLNQVVRQPQAPVLNPDGQIVNHKRIVT